MQKTFFLKYIFAILASLTAFVLSVIPIPEVPELGDVPLIDKWVHFLMYGGVASAVWLDYYRCRDSRRVTPTVLLWAVVWPILLGGLLELWQRYLTDCRSGEWLDFVADTIGTLLALPLGLWVICPHARRLGLRLHRRNSTSSPSTAS